MVFSISWSSVSVASVKAMQLNMEMQHQQMLSDSVNGKIDHQQMMNQQQSMHHTMQNMSVQEMKNHCMEMVKQGQVEDKQEQLKSCHSQLFQAQQVQHSDCQECTLFGCQSSIVWFNTDIPKFTPVDFSEKQTAIQSTYQAQHLVGHWQEILRPPKA